jgi:hypothetical protein
MFQRVQRTRLSDFSSVFSETFANYEVEDKNLKVDFLK